ncbi:hypothetical protein MYX65_01675 [Acidobacteria bacterium AH-259-L09]|nr:hypothetical protein [Acidobacteria bacterium AH-259-L09]
MKAPKRERLTSEQVFHSGMEDLDFASSLEFELLPPVAQEQLFSGSEAKGAGVSIIDSQGKSAKNRTGFGREWSAFERSLTDKLERLDYAYQLALLSLFDEMRPGSAELDSNPFVEALNPDQAEEGLNDAEQVASDEMPEEPVLRDDAITETFQLAVGGWASEETEGGPFDFLVLGAVSESDQRRAFRAIQYSSSDFILDNSAELFLSKGFLVFLESEQLVTTDFNDDEIADFVVVKDDRSGSLVQVFVGKGGAWFQRVSSTRVPGNVVGLSFFEFSGDNQKDLVLVFEGVPRLAIYERLGDEFRYLKELVLPFMPALLVESNLSQGGRGLNVFDSSLENSVTFAVGNANVFVELDSIPFDYQTMSLEFLSRKKDPAEFLVFDSGGRITLAKKTLEGVRFLGSFQVKETDPLILVGDYLNLGSHQLILVP